jgi:hypothetical protein
MTFTGGQPVMDTGLENQESISLYTDQGFWGNSIEDDPDKKVGSDFGEATKLPITRENLIIMRNSAVKALESPIFRNVDAYIEGVSATSLTLTTLVEPPSRTIQELSFTLNGQNWINQKNEPAHLK